MKKVLFLLTMALGLASSFGASIQISALPFNITGPGTYKVTANLVCPTVQSAITIASPRAGSIVLDLEGYALSGSATTGIYVASNATASSITIRNGSLQSFFYGLVAGVLEPTAMTYLSNVHIENITFSDRYADVWLKQVNGSTISDCSFIVPPSSSDTTYGIRDDAGQGGNSYANNSFDGNEATEIEVSSTGPVVLEHFHLEAP